MFKVRKRGIPATGTEGQELAQGEPFGRLEADPAQLVGEDINGLFLSARISGRPPVMAGSG